MERTYNTGNRYVKRNGLVLRKIGDMKLLDEQGFWWVAISHGGCN